MASESDMPQELASIASTSPDEVDLLWQDMKELSKNSRAMTDSELAEWNNALNGVGGSENASCSYSRWSAPRSNDQDALPRYIADAMELAMTGSLSRSLRLSVWFDTPVVAQNKDTWVKDRFNVASDLQWALHRVDDREATEKELHDYQAEKLAGGAAIKRVEDIVAKRGGDFSYVNHPAALRNYLERHPPTQVLHESDNTLVLSSNPVRRSKDPLARHTRATYAILREAPQLHSFEFQNKRAFSPHIGIKVADYRKFGKLDFDPNVNKQTLKYLEQSYQVRLTLLFKQSIEHRQWFSEFACTPNQTASR